MHTLLVLYPPPTSPEAFRDYYIEHHLPLVAKLPGLLSSWHSFEVNGVNATSPYFCVWQGNFASADAMSLAMQSEIGQRVASDTANYASGGVLILHMPINTH